MARYAVTLVGAVTGIATHVYVFRHGEWDLKAPSILTVYAALGITAAALDSYYVRGLLDFPLPQERALDLLVAHVAGIYTSMLIYRAFLHRLNRFPGPFVARLSTFYAAYLSARNLRLIDETERLHKAHGDYVRLGPRELSIIDPEAVVALYGPQAQVSKGPWYGVLAPRVSLQGERDKKVHAKRRKAWDMGFSSKALRNYEERVSKYTSQLVAAIERAVTAGVSIDMSKWANYYSFDVMGDMAFGKSFGMLLNGQDTYFLTALHADMVIIGLFGHLIWLLPFFKLVPGLNVQYLKFWKFLEDQIQERAKNEPKIPDVFSWILKDYNEGPKTVQDTFNLHGDSYLIVVAGSDTTSSTLAVALCYLATNPNISKQLQEELDKYDELSHKKLGEIGFLEGIINEALRLHPAVPGGTQRVTPPEGMQIGDVYIPGDVIVQSPLHTVFRDSRNFERPLEFLPTRWTTEPRLVKNKAVYVPFNAGPYACAGKQLALMELRSALAGLLKRYDVTFAPGENKEQWLGGLKDTFTLVAPPLPLIFNRRVKVE
ncbi:cytochrome P450 monooxygenase [Aspergillus filifer]